MSNIIDEIVAARKAFKSKYNKEPSKLYLGRLKAEDFFLLPTQGIRSSLIAELFQSGLSALDEKSFMGMRIQLTGESHSDKLEIQG